MEVKELGFVLTPVPFGKCPPPPYGLPAERPWGRPAAHTVKALVMKKILMAWSLQRTRETQTSLLRFQLISSKLYLSQRQWIRPSQHGKSWGQASTPSALQPGSPVARRTNATGQRSLASQLHAGSSTGWFWLRCPGRWRPDRYQNRAGTPHTTRS